MYFACDIFTYTFRPIIHLQGDISIVRIWCDQMFLLYSIEIHIVIG